MQIHHIQLSVFLPFFNINAFPLQSCQHPSPNPGPSYIPYVATSIIVTVFSPHQSSLPINPNFSFIEFPLSGCVLAHVLGKLHDSFSALKCHAVTHRQVAGGGEVAAAGGHPQGMDQGLAR